MVEHWDHGQNTGAIGTTRDNVKNDSIDEPAEATAGEKTPVETRARG